METSQATKYLVYAVATILILLGAAVAIRIVRSPDQAVTLDVGKDKIGVEIGKGDTKSAENTERHVNERVDTTRHIASSSTEEDNGEAENAAVVLPGASFPRLIPPQGYVYYEINQEGITTGAGSLGLYRGNAEEYPLVENIKAGDILITTNQKQFRTRPYKAAIQSKIEPSTCLRVISGIRKKIPPTPPIKSAAWLPVEEVPCTK